MTQHKQSIVSVSYILIIFLTSCQTEMNSSTTIDETTAVGEAPFGVTYSNKKTTFQIWSPEAEEVRVNLYTSDAKTTPDNQYELATTTPGVWATSVSGDLKDYYYTFQIKHNNQWLQQAPDPEAKAVGINGKKGMIVDLNETNPTNWKNDKGPEVINKTDIIIYELHIRDISVHPSSGIRQKGKFLGLAESGTVSLDDQATGLDHIKSLGVTHLHILPSFDFKSIDESKPLQDQYNWGYDPQNYNTPEGSYATDAENGKTRIKEFKTLIQVMHNNGLGVILDVVYNHTGDTENSNFNLLAPGYYYRKNADGSLSNASACGNETASEKVLMRNFMIESVAYWAREYHIDGFRFDLMGIHDIITMNEISAKLKAINPNILIYGEGWTAGGSPLPDSLRAIKNNTYLLDDIAVFSDELRDGVKGNWADHKAKGFVSGETSLKESVKFGVVGGIDHDDIDFKQVNNTHLPWASAPTQLINYVSCHDNHTLYDKLKIANPTADEADIIRMHLLSNTIVFTSQGIPFMHAGVEMLRTKNGVENSFESPDSINAIDWHWKTKNEAVFDYYKKLIQLRKNHPAFRMHEKEMVQKHLSFLNIEDEGIIGYEISGNANGDKWDKVLVIFNGNQSSKEITIPPGNYKKIIEDHHINENGLGYTKGGLISVAPTSALILVNDN